MDILMQVFQICIVTILGVLTTFVIKFQFCNFSFTAIFFAR